MAALMPRWVVTGPVIAGRGFVRGASYVICGGVLGWVADRWCAPKASA
jgi:hypothetical protein